MTQGDVNVYVSYDIIAKDFNNPVMSFSADETGTLILSLESVNSSYYIDNTPPVDTNSIAKINTTKINAYPNPTSNTLTFELDTKAKVFAEVYNIEGRVVARQPIVENKLNVASLKTGTYFVVIRSENKVLGTTKFIKE